MLQFYYNPLSPFARRVWIALLEKQIAFKPIVVNLKEREQFKPDFLKINPFHHVPVIVDDGLRVLESMAILDYLECKYRDRPLLTQEPEQLAKVRMAQMVANNELSSLVIPLIAASANSSKLAGTKRKITRILKFLSDLLGDDAYFGRANLSLGDIVAGNAIILTGKLGFDLSQVARIEQWCDRLMQREVWQKTQPNDEQVKVFKQTVLKLIVADAQLLKTAKSKSLF